MEKSVTFPFQARYFLSGNLNKDTRRLVFVLHGYGQQARYFIRKFISLSDQPATCVIAPEGLSRFYLEGFSGRVGATWMTSEGRQTDIHNYLTYLDSIYKELRPQLSSQTEITIIGFSQGAATASRWCAHTLMPINKLVLWAGIFPPDMTEPQVSKKLAEIETIYVYGEQDPFITTERLAEMEELCRKLRVSPRVITFEGVHDIDPGPLDQLFL